MGQHYDDDDPMRRNPLRPLSPEAQAKIAQIKHDGDQMWVTLTLMPPSREVSLAKTKLEEAVMWAVKGISG